jgi:hypothetical protein
MTQGDAMRRTWNAVGWQVGVWSLLAMILPGSALAGGGDTFDCPDCHPLAALRPLAERTRLVSWDRVANWNPLADWHARPDWQMPVRWNRLSEWTPWCDGSLKDSFVCWRAEKRASINKKHPKFEGSGCGPRYWGAYHSEPLRCDPCDSCNRWRGYCGGHEMQEMLLPYQMAPCRGFQPPATAGYGPVSVCRGCKTPTSVWW